MYLHLVVRNGLCVTLYSNSMKLHRSGLLKDGDNTIQICVKSKKELERAKYAVENKIALEDVLKRRAS